LTTPLSNRPNSARPGASGAVELPAGARGDSDEVQAVAQAGGGLRQGRRENQVPSLGENFKPDQRDSLSASQTGLSSLTRASSAANAPRFAPVPLEAQPRAAPAQDRLGATGQAGEAPPLTAPKRLVSTSLPRECQGPRWQAERARCRAERRRDFATESLRRSGESHPLPRPRRTSHHN
jgi:hypothetical protein